MRDAEGDDIARRQLAIRRAVEAAMLVIEPGDDMARADLDRRIVQPAAVPEQRDRQARILADVAPAHGEDGAVALGPRLKPRPQGEGGAQVTRRQGAAMLGLARAHGAMALLVLHRIMGEIAAAAGDDADLAAGAA